MKAELFLFGVGDRQRRLFLNQFPENRDFRRVEITGNAMSQGAKQAILGDNPNSNTCVFSGKKNRFWRKKLQVF
jgi:hypothetical protein